MINDVSPETLSIDMDGEPPKWMGFDECNQCQTMINVNNYDNYKDDENNLITCPNCHHKQKV